MKQLVAILFALVFSSAHAQDTGGGTTSTGGGTNFRDGQFTVQFSLLGGRAKSEATGELVFSNAGSFPSLTSGERIPIGVDKAGNGLELLFGYQWRQWFSWTGGIALLSSKDERDYTTSQGTASHISVKTGAFALMPFIWTGYPLDWVYLQAGIAIIAEALKVESNIQNVNNFTTGSFGGGLVLGAGVDYPVTDTIALNAGIRLIGGRMREQTKNESSGATAYQARLNEHEFNYSTIRLGLSFYF